MVKLKEKISICHTCCGPTYRKSALDKLTNFYEDNDDVYYIVLTDNKEYFKNLKRKNLIVKDLKDYYQHFPEIENNEWFLESTSMNDYSEKFCNINYRFPFSTYRFNIYESIKLGVKNVALLPTDGMLHINNLNNSFFEHTNLIHNMVSEWDENISKHNMKFIGDYLNEKFKLKPDNTIRILDAAARFFVPKDIDTLKNFFFIWNDVIKHVYEENMMNRFQGSYARNDEYILGPIYNVLNLNTNRKNIRRDIFTIQHDPSTERYWRTGGVNNLKEDSNYENFLKKNNLTK
jgi:hypothetical protein